MDFYSLKSHIYLIRIDQFGRRLHNSAKQTATLSSTRSTAHHAGRSTHHVNQKANNKQSRQETRETGRFHFGAIYDWYIVDRLDAQFTLGCLEIALKRIDTADVEPEDALGIEISNQNVIIAIIILKM